MVLVMFVLLQNINRKNNNNNNNDHFRKLVSQKFRILEKQQHEKKAWPFPISIRPIFDKIKLLNGGL